MGVLILEICGVVLVILVVLFWFVDVGRLFLGILVGRLAASFGGNKVLVEVLDIRILYCLILAFLLSFYLVNLCQYYLLLFFLNLLFHNLCLLVFCFLVCKLRFYLPNLLKVAIFFVIFFAGASFTFFYGFDIFNLKIFFRNCPFFFLLKVERWLMLVLLIAAEHKFFSVVVLKQIRHRFLFR